MTRNFCDLLNRRQKLLLATILASSFLFSYHSYTIMGRFFNYEIIQINNAFYNESLLLPVVRMILISARNEKNSKSFAKIRFNATLDSYQLPDWAFNLSSAKVDTNLWHDSIDVNIVNGR